MPSLELEIGSESTDLSYVAKYTGEQFYLELTFWDQSTDAALDLDGLIMSMDLGSIEKEDADFDRAYYDDSNKARVQILESETQSDGSYVGQVTLDSGDTIRKSHPITLVLMSGSSPLTIEALRLSLWDLTAENELHEDVEFPDSLLAQARHQAIDCWNGQPGSHKQYTVDNFPGKWVGKWRTGAMGEAMIMLARNLVGNTIVGGTEVDDKGPRVQAYMQLGTSMRQEWEQFIREQQYYESIQKGYYTLSSG